MNRTELLQIAKPIIFNGEMVRAILDGRKDRTRRPMKGQPQDGANVSAEFAMRHNRPRYKIGDYLYVRETCGNYGDDYPESHACHYLYRADYPKDATGYWYEPEQINWCDFPKWRPSIHMPKEAARIFLRVKDVRAERVQDITSGGVRREGCPKGEQYIMAWWVKLWNSINEKRGYGWDSNPWIWVYVFERVEVE